MRVDSVTLFNNELEELALVSLIKGQGLVRDFLFGNLKEEYFFTPFGKEIFARIKMLMREKNQLPSEIGVVGDLAISENSKTIIKNSDFLLNDSFLKTQGEIKTLVEQLAHWSKLRKLHQVHTLSGEALLDPGKSISNTVSSLTNKLYEINTNSESFESSITKVVDSSTVDLLRSRILTKRTDQYIPTGFKQFDLSNIGLPRGGLTILAATTGGGKCLTGNATVPTSKGNLTLEEIFNKCSTEKNSEGFYPLESEEIYVYTDKLRKKKITHTYKTKGKTIRITFSDGSTIQGLAEHKIWILNEASQPEFKRLDQIKETDKTYKFDHNEIIKFLQTTLASLEAIQPLTSYRGKEIKTVTKLEYFKEETDVYDLHVEDDHTYVVNETMSHNSLMALSMVKHMALAGFKVCLVSLEMNEYELLERRVSSVTGVPITLLRQPESLSEQEKEAIVKQFEKHQAEVLAVNGAEDYKCRLNDLTIEELLYGLKPYGYDVIVVDYLGLLKGVDGDDQWRRLSEAARFCKIFAEENNINVIALAQLSKDGEIRYSKGILEHANNSFSWVTDKKSKEQGIIEVEQKKNRTGETANFFLDVDFTCMTMKDLSDSSKKDRFVRAKEENSSNPRAKKTFFES